jgi:hypothetical protein
VETGRSFAFGAVAPDVLTRSFFGASAARASSP